MKTVGIICEYNPFHYGHVYHLEKVKENFKDYSIVLVLSSYFMQRGEASVLTKWDKTKLALLYGVDLVIELPFAFATQSADIFAKGATQILNELSVDFLVFGSETNNISLLEEIAKIQLYNENYQSYVQYYLKEGLNYPTATAKALLHFVDYKIEKPNDLLALSYVKEIIKNNYKMKPVSILRTNDYHQFSNTSITSASSIRTFLKEGKDIQLYIPKEVRSYIHPIFIDDLFPYLKYKILTSDIQIYQTVDEGLSYRIKNHMKTSNSLEEFMNKVKTKRYTYNRLMRMCIHILCDFTKEEAKKIEHIGYLRVLGFSKKGRLILKECHSDIPIITNLKDCENALMDLEIKATIVYQMLYKEENILEMEYKRPPIIAEK